MPDLSSRGTTARVIDWAGSCLILGLGCLLILDGLASWLRGIPASTSLWLSAGGGSPLFASAVGVLLLLSRVGTEKPWRSWLIPLLTSLAILAGYDSCVFWRLTGEGAIRSSLWVPLSALVAGIFLLAIRRPSSPWISPAKAVGAATSCGVLVLLHILTFGTTDYTRPVDCAVVFGAKIYADGRPSDATMDRVRTAARLYREGKVKMVLASGGTGREGVNEARRMRELLVEAGVPEQDVRVDAAGTSTAETLRTMRWVAKEEGVRSFLSVTHYFHQARVKMMAERMGLRCYTVPADMPRRLIREPYFVLREVPAFLYYQLFC